MNIFKTLLMAFTILISAQVSASPVAEEYKIGQSPGMKPNIGWANKEYRYYINSSTIPAYLKATFVDTVKQATDKWSAVCGIKFTYLGDSRRTVPYNVANENVIYFGSRPKYADGSYVAGSTFWFEDNITSNLYQANIIMTNSVAAPVENILGTVTHELGHAIGIEHSDKSESIMYATPYHTSQYAETLRQDDIDACVSLYGKPTTPVVQTPTTTPTQPTTNAPSVGFSADDIRNIRSFFNWAHSLGLVPTKTMSYASGYYYEIYEDGSIVGVSLRNGKPFVQCIYAGTTVVVDFAYLSFYANSYAGF